MVIREGALEEEGSSEQGLRLWLSGGSPSQGTWWGRGGSFGAGAC